MPRFYFGSLGHVLQKTGTLISQVCTGLMLELEVEVSGPALPMGSVIAREMRGAWCSTLGQ